MVPEAGRRISLLQNTTKASPQGMHILFANWYKRISDFVQASVHPVPCSTSRLVKLSKTFQLFSDFSCKMARIMVIGKNTHT